MRRRSRGCCVSVRAAPLGCVDWQSFSSPGAVTGDAQVTCRHGAVPHTEDITLCTLDRAAQLLSTLMRERTQLAIARSSGKILA